MSAAIRSAQRARGRRFDAVGTDVLAGRVRRSNESPVSPTEELLAERQCEGDPAPLSPRLRRVVTRPTDAGRAWLSAEAEPGFVALVACEGRR